VALAPFLVVVAFATLIGVAVIVTISVPRCFMLHRRFTGRLKEQGRLPNLLPGHLKQGTLIVDDPTFGCNAKYCWWSPDDLLKISPHEIPSDEDREQHIKNSTDKLHMDFDEWCYETYLSVSTGTAILLTMKNGDELADRIIDNAPDIGCVKTWSGPCFNENI